MALATHIADAEGVLKPSTRIATVYIYEPLADEQSHIYEMGVPVVELGDDKWHIDVQQKVPLSLERDNVPPAYLRKLRAEVFNQLCYQVKGDDISQPWVKAATSAPEAKPEAVNHYLNETFTEKRVIFDPSDQEANKIAVAQGYQVIYPRSLSTEQWSHVKQNNLAQPAGQVTPSHKVNIEMALDGTANDSIIPVEKWTPGLRNIAEFSKAMAAALGIGQITVAFTSNISANYIACYGGKRLMYAVGKLGHAWFNQGVREEVMDLLLHELAHEYSGDHLSKQFNDAISMLGGKMTQLALDNPNLFAKYGARVVSHAQVEREAYA
jgi:hypothetical protein